MASAKNSAVFLLVFVVLATALLAIRCGGKPLMVGNHRLGETITQFNAIEKSTEEHQGVEDIYTGTIHCFNTKTIGDHCQGSRLIDGLDIFDGAHYTFVGGRLTSIEFVGLGGLIGEPSENVNWNLYLRWLTNKYGRATQMTPTTAVWMKGSSVVYAYLEPGTLAYTNKPYHAEHILFLTRESYDQRQR